jgi:riboflavin kinase/FMN adenylyltransferase
MRVIRDIADVPSDLNAPVVTIGNFDGVHCGHRQLLDKVHEAARQHRGSTVVITFRPHPVVVTRPDLGLRLLTSYDQKLALLEASGIDLVAELIFDDELRAWSAERFIQDWLVDGLRVRHVVAGPDSRFGKGREGNAQLLSEWGNRLGFTVESVPPVLLDGAPVSSSRIRKVLQEAGDVVSAANLLGRPVQVRGLVVEGERRGRDIGFPTANLDLGEVLVPRNGVYAAYASLQGHRYSAVVNIGVKPTFGTHARAVEAHLLDYQGNCYGEEIALDFVKRLRDECRFSSVDELVVQIKTDVQTARGLFP